MEASEEACEQVRALQSPRVLMGFVGPQSPGGLDLVHHNCDGMDWDLRSLSVGPIEQGLVLHNCDAMGWDLRSLLVGLEDPVDLLSWGGDWAPQNCAAVDSDQGSLGSEQGYWEGIGFVEIIL